MTKTITRTFPKEYVYDILDSDYEVLDTITADHELKKREQEKALRDSDGTALVLVTVKEETREMSVEDFIAHSTVVE